MKCSVYIATSVDGFIARTDGSIDWLETSGQPEKGTGSEGFVDFSTYMASVDCLIMGRKCMEVISGFDLSPDQWPYGKTRIIVLSKTVSRPPANLAGKVELYSGDIPQLMQQLSDEGHRHAYVDGGTTIQSFLKLGLISEMTITRIPVLLGEGIPLFGPTGTDIQLDSATAMACPNDFVQLRYKVRCA